MLNAHSYVVTHLWNTCECQIVNRYYDSTWHSQYYIDNLWGRLLHKNMTLNNKQFLLHHPTNARKNTISLDHLSSNQKWKPREKKKYEYAWIRKVLTLCLKVSNNHFWLVVHLHPRLFFMNLMSYAKTYLRSLNIFTHAQFHAAIGCIQNYVNRKRSYKIQCMQFLTQVLLHRRKIRSALPFRMMDYKAWTYDWIENDLCCFNEFAIRK